jgi:hypothetical protein
MAMATGLDSQFGFTPETTVGTRIAPATFLPLVSENIKYNRERLVSKGMRAGRRTQGLWRPGRGWVDGGFTIELAPQSTGKLFRWCTGAVSTSGAGPYTHVFTNGTLDDRALTIQVGKPDRDGTVRPFDYIGCMCTGYQIGLKVGEYAMFNPSVYGMQEDLSQSLASAAYPTTYTPFTYISGALSIAGAEYEIDDAMITAALNLATGRHKITGTSPDRPKASKESGFRQIGGTLNGDYISNVAYQRFVNGTEAALSLVMTDGAAASLTIAGNVRFDGDTPNVAGPMMLKQALPFVFTSLTSDAAAFTMTLVNSDATP